MNDEPPAAAETSRKRFGWTQRTANGGVSILAVIETALATAFSLWLVIVLESWWHVLASAALAPLLMLRSPDSVDEGADRFSSWLISFKYNPDSVFPMVTLYPRLLLVALFIRVTSTMRHVRKGMTRLSSNYTDALTNSDLSQGVPLVPETESFGELVDEFTFFGDLRLASLLLLAFCLFFAAALLAVILVLSEGTQSPLIPFEGLSFLDDIEERAWVPFVGIATAAVLAMVLLLITNILFAYIFFAAAIWLRLSVKSTALIWLPLFYLATRKPKGREQIQTAIVEERHSALSQVIRVFAWVSLALFLWRALIFPSSSASWFDQEWAEVLLVVILPVGTDPSQLSLWHIAAGLSALITLGCYYFVWDKGARQIEANKPVTERVISLYGYAYWVRGLLAIYTIICAFYYVAIGAQLIRVPEISWCPFPWLAGCG